jgi:glycosyltransferase involved in cell wall biosynthesis
MKALMIHTENSAVGKYRIWMQAKYLRRIGWEVVEMDREKTGIDIAELEKKLSGVDIIVCQRLDNLKSVAAIMAAGQVADCPVVVDFDDNIFDVSPNSPAYKDYHPGSEGMLTATQMLEHAAAVTVSTPALKEAYKAYNENIHVLRNCQDLEDWEGIYRPEQEEKMVIGWAGSYTHYDDLKLIEKPIKKILRKNDNVVFRILGLKPDFLVDIPGVEFRNDWVTIDKFPAKLAELNFDLGLVPLVDTAFNQGKSNIKWQEYSMLAFPTIASKVGEYKKSLLTETTILVNTEKQWERAIQDAIDSNSYFSQVGLESKRKVEADYNIANNIGQWDEVYRQVIQQFQAS